ncbi:MAG TPA: hypothetical protein VFU93_10015 [Acidimicrobiales bacterium]|nr:hypothetical protein [Acidimicrobiales bacterium]
MIDVRIETGKSRVFAIAIDWPGWARSGKTEAEAIETLLDYGDRYKQATGARVAVMEANVVERAKGDSGTDFGVPGFPKADAEDIDARELGRQVKLLRACWKAFDDAARAAKGKTLTKGPRGGGRTLAKIVEHQAESELAYLAQLGGDRKARDPRAAFVEALDQRRRGELPDTGPRGGRRWTPREAIRRSAWHALDHAWEIEDRSGGA